MRRIPDWLRCSLPSGEQYARIKKIVREQNLHTVCLEAKCPNIGECFSGGTATFMILGNICTRDCRYCAVSKGNPLPVDFDEPLRIASAVLAMHISHVVITSVTRDDLLDGGASIFARVVELIRAQSPSTKVELLVPDFLRSRDGALDAVFDAAPDVFNHNIEVVRPLFPLLRPHGDYLHSLYVLTRAAKRGLLVKTGLMVGFGETQNDIVQTMRDVRNAGVSMITIGQYLQSHRNAYPVARYYHPDEFAELEAIAKEIGFAKAMCGPLVRSSYHAAEMGDAVNKGCL